MLVVSRSSCIFHAIKERTDLQSKSAGDSTQMSTSLIWGDAASSRSPRAIAIVTVRLLFSRALGGCAKRFVRPTVILLFLLTMLNCVHATEIFSVRCEGGRSRPPLLCDL